MMNWEQAIEQTLTTTRLNVKRFGKSFPIVSMGNGKYHLTDHTNWTEGFWSGILWLSYEYSQDPEIHAAAIQATDSFRQRMLDGRALDHHDIGFLYSLSAKARWIADKDEASRLLALQAADQLMKRWRPGPQLFQAWGPEGDEDNGGRIIIDCLMNLPLLCWASEQTGDPSYARAARIHAETSRRFLVRGDDSSYHTFYFDQQTGDALRGGRRRGIRTAPPGHGARLGASTASLSLTAASKIRIILKPPKEWPATSWSISPPIMSPIGISMPRRRKAPRATAPLPPSRHAVSWSCWSICRRMIRTGTISGTP